MAKEITVEIEAQVDDALDEIIDKYGDEAEELLSAATGRWQVFVATGTVQLGEVWEHISDDDVKEEYLERFDNVPIDAPRDFIAAIGYLADGDKHMAQTMFHRAFQGQDMLIRSIDEAIR